MNQQASDQSSSRESGSDGMQHSAAETLASVSEEVATFVKKNPWTAVAIAAGIGFVVGRILGRGEE